SGDRCARRPRPCGRRERAGARRQARHPLWRLCPQRRPRVAGNRRQARQQNCRGDRRGCPRIRPQEPGRGGRPGRAGRLYVRALVPAPLRRRAGNWERGPVSVVEEIAPADTAGEAEAAEDRSLIADVEVLIDDGKTYLEAELNYQKTRALYAGDRLKGLALYGL